MVIGYTRVSTNFQTVESQQYSIKEYCSYKKFKLDKFVNETISGTVPREKRVLGILCNSLQEGDVLIVSELSRLGRTIIDTLVTLEMLQNKKVEVHLIKENLVSGTLEFNMMCAVYAIIAQTERQRISERTREALRMRMANGQHIGRRKGEKPKVYKLTPYKTEIEVMINNHVSIYSIAKKYNVKWITAKNFVKNNLNLN